MPNFCRVWLTSFLDKMSEYHKCANDAKERIARDTIQWTMKNAYPQMVSTFTKELCALFETYWTHDTSAKMPFYSGHLSDDYLYGLNDAAEHYNHKFQDVDNNPFFINLFGPNLLEGFEWAIYFVNRLISAFAENCPDQIAKVEGVLESMAEYYSVELAQKINRGMQLNAEKCLSNGSNPGLGYKVDKDRKFYIDEDEAAIVREIFNRYASGEVTADIIRDLNNRRIRTSRGKEFNKNSISRILHNKRYI